MAVPHSTFGIVSVAFKIFSDTLQFGLQTHSFGVVLIKKINFNKFRFFYFLSEIGIVVTFRDNPLVARNSTCFQKLVPRISQNLRFKVWPIACSPFQLESCFRCFQKFWVAFKFGLQTQIYWIKIKLFIKFSPRFFTYRLLDPTPAK